MLSPESQFKPSVDVADHSSEGSSSVVVCSVTQFNVSFGNLYIYMKLYLKR